MDQSKKIIGTHLKKIEKMIVRQAAGFPAPVGDYLDYICSRGGKRLRPTLALLAGGAAGGIRTEHENLGVVVELVHIATLVHDDIIDEADLRRGEQTPHAKWGAALSVLLGDLLFAQALRLATEFADMGVSSEIGRAATAVCSGEILQTHRRFDTKISIKDYLKIIEMKTAALFSISSEMAAVLAGAPKEHCLALRNFGLKLGTAYQIYDDILDFAGEEAQSGKTLGTDIMKGKFTLPVILLLQKLAPSKSLALFKKGACSFLEIRRLVAAENVLPTAGARAAKLLAEASICLQSLPPSPYRDALEALCDDVLARITDLLR